MEPLGFTLAERRLTTIASLLSAGALGGAVGLVKRLSKPHADSGAKERPMAAPTPRAGKGGYVCVCVYVVCAECACVCSCVCAYAQLCAGSEMECVAGVCGGPSESVVVGYWLYARRPLQLQTLTNEL